jgi:hypothetical protein
MLPNTIHDLEINNELDCAICLDSLNSDKHISICKQLLSCRHVFHSECIDTWLKDNSTCPICRGKCKVKNIIDTAPSANITINIPITINNYHNRNNGNSNNNKFKKYIFFFLYSLFISYHVGSSIYYYYQSHRINNNINNYIKTLNDTELGDHSHNTYLEEVLIGTDLFYYLMFILVNMLVFKNIKDCCCSKLGGIIIVVGVCIGNFIIHSEFYRNTNSYLTDKELNFDISYNTDLDLALLLYYTSYVGELLFSAVMFIQYSND